jgi:membrane-associated protease RseP (regulator of RpoE activity)
MSQGVAASAEQPKEESLAGRAPGSNGDGVATSIAAAAEAPKTTSQPPIVVDPFHDPAVAHLPELCAADLGFRPQRRVVLPIVLFIATCLSTFWVGITGWDPLRVEYTASWQNVRQLIELNWTNGLAYMGAVLAILLTHEMGHFLQTVKYGIPASYPLCIPVPFNPIGTMGAVIGMDGSRADRRQIFDIGIAGPLAGLGIAFPVLWQGIKHLDLSQPAAPGTIEFYLPLAAQWMLKWAHPDVAWADAKWVALSQINNPYFMAGWVGMLITGLNMLPISQLDGGHTIYALFLDRAHSFARFFISFAILYVVVNLDEAVLWTPMLLLVIFLGIHHPPTRDDSVPLGPVRWAIGLASLAIPVICFPLFGVRQ